MEHLAKVPQTYHGRFSQSGVFHVADLWSRGGGGKCSMALFHIIDPIGKYASRGRARISGRRSVSRLTKRGQREVFTMAKDSGQHDTTDCNSNIASDGNGEGTEMELRSRIGSLVEGEAARPAEAMGIYGVSEGSSKLGLIFPVGEVDSWDSAVVSAPVVRRYLSDNEERWLMWYCGRPVLNTSDGAGAETEAEEGGNNRSKDSIGIAVSSNGIRWQRGKAHIENNEHGSSDAGKVMESSNDWWAFDSASLYPSDILVMTSAKIRAAAGVYWLYYEGGCAEELTLPRDLSLSIPRNMRGFRYHGGGKVSVRRTRPGLALSHDGRNWARIEGEHHSDSLFDVGADGEWDSLFIGAPHVVFHREDDLRMYYHSFDPKRGCFVVGFARSRNGIRWVKLGEILGAGSAGLFDELGAMAPHVVPDPCSEGYLMIYEGIDAVGRSGFGLARSSDGLTQWDRCHDTPIFSPALVEAAWDSCGVHSPCLVHLDGYEWRLYYQGVDKQGKTGIGMAVCSDGQLKTFKRCQGLHL